MRELFHLMLAGTLSGIEMGLRLAGIPHKDGWRHSIVWHLQNAARRQKGRAASCKRVKFVKRVPFFKDQSHKPHTRDIRVLS